MSTVNPADIPARPVDVVLHPHIKRRPQRGDAVEAWIKSERDQYRTSSVSWIALDNLLDEYRLLADTGRTLDGGAA